MGNKNTLDVLCQLPPIKDVEEKFQECIQSNSSTKPVNLYEVRNKVKAFYTKLFDNSKLGKYFSRIANDAIGGAWDGYGSGVDLDFKP